MVPKCLVYQKQRRETNKQRVGSAVNCQTTVSLWSSFGPSTNYVELEQQLAQK